MPIVSELQKLSTSPMVELFLLADFNHTNIADEFRFTNWRSVTWLGNQYNHIDFKTSGFESNGRSLPRPRIQLSITGALINNYLKLYDDLIGATLYRYKTQESYLLADSAEMLAIEEWQIQQKTNEDHVAGIIEWELSAIDLENTNLPGRTYQSNYCEWQYRDGVGCPYSGLPVADINDQPTTNSLLDDCGRKIGSCRLRFGNTAQLPIGFFPVLQ
jgi:lambda family phage minor tail protein L